MKIKIQNVIEIVIDDEAIESWDEFDGIYYIYLKDGSAFKYDINNYSFSKYLTSKIGGNVNAHS